MERYICVHGHFYQPPRENPWLEAVELQDSAFPYHDWNERITAECYGPNSASRIVDNEAGVLDILSNYSRMSFNFGPTLLSWMEAGAPDIYAAIIRADAESQQRFSGHGSAIAQVYNHMILPLANRRDKETQVRWGIRDFEYRFARKPEGMWLSESAADTETLEVLAEHGIVFTILAPNQAHRVRRKTGGAWSDVSGNRIDPTRPYECKLPSGRSIVLFFYDGPISQGVAFEGLLASGERFAGRLVSGFSDKRTWDQLMHIATDGETYGHHHKFGDMALCYALRHIETNNLATITNYGEYLEKHPPLHAVEIFENSSWSCVHGVERWRSNCGCHSGGSAGWNQEWRGPLRKALDYLRDELAPLYEEAAGKLLLDPWIARDGYVDVILDRSPAKIAVFLSQHASRDLSPTERTRVLKLLEMQRHAMLMYTSCGWFFDELTGIETVQVIQYAARSIQLAQELFDRDLEEGFLERLQEAHSNVPDHGNGRQVYEKLVKPGIVDLAKVAAHYAIASLFMSPADHGCIYAYRVEDEKRQLLESGSARLLIGMGKFVSEVTYEEATFDYVVLHFGDHNLTCGVTLHTGPEAMELLTTQLRDTFSRGELPEVLRFIDKHFSNSTYSPKSLFKDQQKQVLDSILRSTLDQAAANMRGVFNDYAPLMSYLNTLGVRQPRVLKAIARIALSADLRDTVEQDVVDLNHLRAILNDLVLWDIDMDLEGMEYTVNRNIQQRTEQFAAVPMDVGLLRSLSIYVEAASMLPCSASFWHPQNLYFELLDSLYPAMVQRVHSGDRTAANWVTAFLDLGRKLKVRLPE